MAAVYLFHTSGNVTCTITDQRYASLLEQSVFPDLKVRRYDTTTVFQDGAPPHIARCSAAILVTTESSSGNFIQLDLLDPPTRIFATFGCWDT